MFKGARVSRSYVRGWTAERSACRRQSLRTYYYNFALQNDSEYLLPKSIICELPFIEILHRYANRKDFIL